MKTGKSECISPWFAFGCEPTQQSDFRIDRRKKLSGSAMHEAVRMHIHERMSIRAIADVLGVSHMTIYRMLNNQPIAVFMEQEGD